MSDGPFSVRPITNGGYEITRALPGCIGYYMRDEKSIVDGWCAAFNCAWRLGRESLAVEIAKKDAEIERLNALVDVIYDEIRLHEPVAKGTQ